MPAVANLRGPGHTGVMNILRLLSLAMAGLVLASCYAPPSPSQWDHPQMSVNQQQADRAECRQRANFQTEREIEREGPFMAEQRDAQLQQMFDRHDQAARTRQVYDNCLRDKGYAPVVPERR